MGRLKEVRIGEICEVVKGNIGISKAITGNFPLVTTGQNRLSHNEFQFDCTAVCIPLVSSSGHGKASLNYVHYQEGKFAVGNILCACIPFDVDTIDARYLHLYLQTFKNELLVSLMRGMANVSLSIDKIKGVKILLPDLPTQRNIIARLQSLQSLHREADAVLTRLKADVKRLRQSILQDAIQGKLIDYQPEPGEKTGAELLADIRAEKERRAREAGKKPDKPLPPVTPEEMPFALPEGWVWCRLGELLESSFYGPRFSDSAYIKNGIPTIRTTDMTDKGEIILRNAPTVKVESNKMKLYKVEDGDLLVTRSGSIGIMAIFRGEYEAIPSAYLIRFRFFQIISPEFIYTVLKSPYWQKLMGLSTTSTSQVNINARSISDFSIPIPPISIQNQIVNTSIELLNQSDQLEHRIAVVQMKIKRLWKSELQQTFQFESND